MRDPDLVTRAQRAAVALERAWERWRAMHGLSAEPMPPVTSYVGYSIEEPWGRPRVVFGVDAREAELLAALLDHHECVGPFYQADPSDALLQGSPVRDASPLDAARSRIPAQAQAAEGRPQRWGLDREPGAADDGPDGLTGNDGDEPRYQDRDSPRENGPAELPRQDEAHGDSGRNADHRRARRTEPGRPSRRERRAASRQRAGGPREPITDAAGPETQEHAADGREAETAWPPPVDGPSWPDLDVPDREVADHDVADREVADGAPAGHGSSAPAVYSTTVDSIPVQGTAADRAAATPDGGSRGSRGRSLYDVTKASRERRREAARTRGAGDAGGRGAGQASRRQGPARDLGQVRAAAAGRGGAEPVSSNAAADAGHTDTGPIAAEPASPEPAGMDLTGQDRAAAAAGQAQPGRADDAARDHGYPAPDGQERPDGAETQRAVAAQWAQDTDPGLDYSADQGLDYGDDAGLDYAADSDPDYPGDDGWDDLAAPGESWESGFADAAGSATDRDTDPGRSDVAGLGQLWGMGHGSAGPDHAPDAPGQPHDAAGQDPLGGTAPGGTGPGGTGPGGTGPGGTAPGVARDGAEAGPGDAGLGDPHSNGAAGHASAARDPGTAWGTGPAPDSGPARATRQAREAGPGGEEGSEWDTGTPRETGPGGEGGSAWDAHTAREAGAGPAREARRDLPGDFGPDPLGVRASRESADFLAAPPTATSILTAPRPESRTARPGNVGTETIAAELAGWAAGELPGQASARLAAWAAIGGVPAAGYHRTDASDVGPAGMATERVR